MRDIEEALARALLAQQRTRQAAVDIGEQLAQEAKEAQEQTAALIALSEMEDQRIAKGDA